MERLQDFFGPPRGVADPGDPRSAYMGKSKHLTIITAELLAAAPALLPWRMTENVLEICWDQVSWEGRAPSAGVQRVEHAEYVGDTYFALREPSFSLEGDFNETDAGRARYKVMLDGIRDAVAEVARASALDALLKVPYWLPPPIETAGTYALLQSPRGAEEMVRRATEALAAAGVAATRVLIPPSMAPFQAAIAACGPFEVTVSEPFQGGAQPLHATRSVGEYYVMTGPELHIEDAARGGGLAPVFMREALANCGRFGPGGRLAGLDALSGLSAAEVPPDMFLRARTSPTALGAWEAVETLGDIHPSFLPDLPENMRAVPVTLESFLGLQEFLPFRMVLLRPAISRTMASAVFMDSSTRTGETLVGNIGFEVSYSMQEDAYAVTGSILCKSVVYQQKTVHVARDVLHVGPVSGCGIEFGVDLFAVMLPRNAEIPAALALPWGIEIAGAGAFYTASGVCGLSGRNMTVCRRGHSFCPATGTDTGCLVLH